MNAARPSRRPPPLVVVQACLLVLGYAALIGFGGVRADEVASVWWFVALGVFGASVANATGAGGGVVFVPAFSVIAASGGPVMSTGQIVAASLLIQSFGMTTGAVTWGLRLSGPRRLDLGVPPGVLREVVLLTLAATLPALWATQGLARLDGGSLLLLFKSFSLILGLALLASLTHPGARTARYRPADRAALIAIGSLGGVATALFSVGVGELLALYLFLRGFGLTLSVASAVIVSAVTVLAALPGALLTGDPYLPVVAAAAPGVIVGGVLGRRLALRLGTQRLKLFTGLWIAGSSLFLIARSL